MRASKHRTLFVATGVATGLALALLVSPAALRGAEDDVVPMATPEEVGIVIRAAAARRRLVQRYIDDDMLAGGDHVDRPSRQGRALRGAGVAAQGSQPSDAEGCHLYDHVDDQTDRLDGADDALRGGPLPPRRPDLEVAAGVRRQTGPHQRRPATATRAGGPAGDRPSRTHAHLGTESHAAAAPR